MLTRSQLAEAGYPKHAATLAWLDHQIGQHEQPPGSNRGSFVQFCQSATWLGGTGWAWCRALVLRARLKGGFTLPDESAGAWDALERARKRGDGLIPAMYGRAIPGDEVIWSFGAGHSSTLESFEHRKSGVYVHTIDGNVQDRVERCVRPLSLVKGFIVWHESPKPVKPVKPPRRQVVGSISGKRQLVTRKGLVLPLPAKKAGPAGIVRVMHTVDVQTIANGASTSAVSVTAANTQPTKASVAKKPAPKKRATKAAGRVVPARPRSTPKKPAPRRRYYTLKRNVPLKKGETVGYQPKKGYYARPKKA